MKLQQGSLALLQRAQAAGVPTHIISVNWSSELVRAALQQAPLCGDAGISGKAAASLASQGVTCTDLLNKIGTSTDMTLRDCSFVHKFGFVEREDGVHTAKYVWWRCLYNLCLALPSLYQRISVAECT